MQEIIPISTETLWVLVFDGIQPAHFSNDEDEWQCAQCHRWRQHERYLVYVPNEETGKLSTKEMLCGYCAQQRALTWNDPLLKHQIDLSVPPDKRVKIANADFSQARLRRVTYSNGHQVDELMVRRAPRKL